MRLIYVAGKYSSGADGRAYSGIEDNIRHAERVSLLLLKKGWSVLTPHKNTAHYELFEDFLCMDHKKWLDMHIEMLKRCDAIMMLTGWHDSPGAKEEFDFAVEHKIPIYLEDAKIPSPKDVGGDREYVIAFYLNLS